MGKYSKETLESNCVIARQFIDLSGNNNYALLYWLCTYWMLIAALNTGTYYVNARTCKEYWDVTSMVKYRNAYAHANSDIYESYKYILSDVTFDMCNYDEYTARACALLGVFPQP